MLRRLLSWVRKDRSERVQPRRTRSPRDHSPGDSLPAVPGELWIGFRLGEDEQADQHALEALVQHVESTGLGEWTGQSTGAGQRDVTFDVSNKRRARSAIAGYFARELPTRDFWISTEYQTTFDRV